MLTGSVPQLLVDGNNYYLYGPSIGTGPLEQISISGSIPTYLVSDSTGVRQQLDSSGTLTRIHDLRQLRQPLPHLQHQYPIRIRRRLHRHHWTRLPRSTATTTR